MRHRRQPFLVDALVVGEVLGRDAQDIVVFARHQVAGQHVRTALYRRLEIRQRLLELARQRYVDDRRHLVAECGVGKPGVVAADDSGSSPDCRAVASRPIATGRPSRQAPHWGSGHPSAKCREWRYRSCPAAFFGISFENLSILRNELSNRATCASAFANTCATHFVVHCVHTGNEAAKGRIEEIRRCASAAPRKSRTTNTASA